MEYPEIETCVEVSTIHYVFLYKQNWPNQLLSKKDLSKYVNINYSLIQIEKLYAWKVTWYGSG